MSGIVLKIGIDFIVCYFFVLFFLSLSLSLSLFFFFQKIRFSSNTNTHTSTGERPDCRLQQRDTRATAAVCGHIERDEDRVADPFESGV